MTAHRKKSSEEKDQEKSEKKTHVAVVGEKKKPSPYSRSFFGVL